MMLKMMMLRTVVKRMMMLLLRKMRWRLMMLRMMRSRGRKMMMLTMVLRRRKMMMFQDDDVEDEDRSQDREPFARKMPPTKTGDHTVCDPAQSTCTSQEPFYPEIYRKKAAAQNRGPHFVRACAVEMHINVSQGPFYTEIYRKNARPRTAAQTLCKPAQSTCTSTCHKSLFIQIFFMKNAAAQNRGPHSVRACAVETHINASQIQFILKITRKMPRPSWSTLIKHRPSHLP